MAMKFKKATYSAPQGEFTYEYVEPSKTHFRGWKLKFTKNNLRSSSSLLTVIGKKEGEEDIVAPCSRPLTKKLREKLSSGELTQREVMAYIWFKTWIIEGQNQAGEDRVFIAFPQGQAGEELDTWGEEDFKIDEEKIEALAW